MEPPKRHPLILERTSDLLIYLVGRNELKGTELKKMRNIV
jgi:hypothetical protein